MIAMVTGATAGFGAEIARELVKAGFKVIITGRRIERLNTLKEELGEACFPLCFDISDENATFVALESLPEKWRNIDILVNNAGLALGVEPAPDCDFKDWQQMINTNITGLVMVTHYILPQMVKRNHGHIINIGSIAGTYPYLGGNVYGATKAFVKQFSLNLRSDLIGTKIRVSNIEPGLCGGTEFSQVRYHGDNQKAEALYEGVDYLTAKDIAQTVLWVATCPPHMNVNRVEIMPVAQAPAGLKIERNQKN